MAVRRDVKSSGNISHFPVQPSSPPISKPSFSKLIKIIVPFPSFGNTDKRAIREAIISFCKIESILQGSEGYDLCSSDDIPFIHSNAVQLYGQKSGACAMIKRSAFLLLFVLMTFNVYARDEDVLVRIEHAQNQLKGILHDYQGKICFQTDTFLLATVTREALPEMDVAGIVYQILDNQPWSEPYYLMSSRGDLNEDITRSARIIFQDESEAIIKLADEQAFELAKQHVQLTRIFDHDLPLVPERPQSHLRVVTAPAPGSHIEDLVAQVSDSTYRSYLQRLQDFRTRYSFSDSIAPARNWLKSKFMEFGYTDVVLDPFYLNGTLQQNVVATKPGTQNTDRVIIVGGHYDCIVHFSENPQPMLYAPGVDDNGSGTAATLEIGRVLADTDLETTVLFVPFAAEEQGLWGSSHFAQSAFETGLNIDIVFNMDMIANVADAVPDFNILTNAQSRGYADIVLQMTETFSNLLPEIGASGGGSDHLPFQQYGFPAIFLQEGDFSPHWHRNSDVIDNVSVPYATEVTSCVLASVVMVANTPGVPSDLMTVDVGDGTSQILMWEPNQEPDLAGYHVYLGETSGAYDQIFAVTSAVDTLLNLTEGVPHYAAVSAFDADGNESLLSSEIVFTPQLRPATPLGLASTSSATQIELNWEANNDEVDLVGYRITRTAPNSTLKIFNVDKPNTHFVDTSVEPHVLYHYAIQAVDSDGNLSAASILVRGQLATHDRGVLIVDGTRDGATPPLQPSDEEVDLFYQNILQNFEMTAQWDVADSAAQSLRISDADMAIYSTVVWHSDAAKPGQRIAADTLALKKYLQNGGHLLMVGWNLMGQVSSQSASLKTFGPGEFAYDFLQVETAETGTASDVDFIGADPVVPDYPSLTVNSSKVPVFEGNLFAMEVFGSLVGGEATGVLYTYRSSAEPPSARQGRPVAFRHLGDDLKVIVIDIPLYFIPENEAKQLVSRALVDLGETVTGVGEPATPIANVPEEFYLSQNYPNPFNPTTNIQFAVPQKSRVTLKIFDLLGKEVRTLIDEEMQPGEYSHLFDAGDLASGVYFYQLQAGGFVASKKLLLMK